MIIRMEPRDYHIDLYWKGNKFAIKCDATDNMVANIEQIFGEDWSKEIENHIRQRLGNFA